MVDERYFDIDCMTYSTLDIILNCTLLNCVSIFGIVGHVLSIMVLRLHNLRDSTTMILLSLSVIDLVYIITTSIRRSHCIIGRFDVSLSQIFIAFDRVYLATINRIAVGVSTSHVVLISVERAFAVYYPFKVSYIFSTNWTRIYLLSVYLIWIILKAPYFDGYTIVWLFDTRLNRTVASVVNSQFRAENYSALNLVNMITSNARGPVNICIVLICTILISRKLHQTSVRRLAITALKQTLGVELRIVKMLLSVCLVYLIVGIPVFAPYTFFFYIVPEAFFTSKGSPTRLYLLVDSAIDLLYVVNCSLNFIIYVKISSKFASTFKRVVRCARDRKYTRAGSLSSVLDC